jgi:hypothetical protein
LENLSVHLIDQLVGEQWSARLQIDLTVDGLQLRDLLNQDIIVGKVILALSEIKVDQPAGFSQTPLLMVDKIGLAIPGFEFGTSRLPISKVLLDHLVASVERNPNGITNLQKLFDAWVPDRSGAKQQKKTTIVQLSAGDKPAAAAGMPTLVFEDIRLKSIALQLLAFVDGKPWRTGFDGLDINAMGLDVGGFAQPQITLDSFSFDLKGAVVDQPPGFDTDKLARFERLTVTTDGLDLDSPEYVVKQVLVQGLVSSVTVRKDGSSNMQQLNNALFGRTEKVSESTAQSKVEKEISSSENIQPMVRFERIQMEGGSLIYRNETLSEDALIFPLDNIEMEVTQLRLFDDNADADPALASMSFELGQPGKLPTAYFGSVAAVGPVSGGIPPVNAQVRLTGLKLDTLGSLVPQTTRTTLGATGLDVGVALALDAETIKMQAFGLTDRNIHYNAIKMQGPLNNPNVEIGPVLAGISRVSGGLLNMGKGGMRAGVGIAKGGVDVTKEVGSGVLKIGGSLGKNLFKVVTGLVTVDKQQLGEGIVDATKGAAGLTADSVQGAGSTAGDGLKGSFSDLKGDVVLQAWDDEIPTRHQAAMQQAQKALAEMPYPPVAK